MLNALLDVLPPSPASAREGVAHFSPAAQAPAEAAAAVQPTPETVRRAVTSANQALRSFSQAVEFEYDPDADVTVIRLVDTQSRQVLRQIPSPEMLDIARALDRMQVMLLRTRA